MAEWFFSVAGTSLFRTVSQLFGFGTTISKKNLPDVRAARDEDASALGLAKLSKRPQERAPMLLGALVQGVKNEIGTA
jgi:hypothetical protein